TKTSRNVSGVGNAGSRLASIGGVAAGSSNGVCSRGATLVNRQSSVRGDGSGNARNRPRADSRSGWYFVDAPLRSKGVNRLVKVVFSMIYSPPFMAGPL